MTRIEFDLPSGDKLVFADLDELNDFFKAELVFWDWLRAANVHGAIQGPSNQLEGFLKKLPNIAKEWQSAPDDAERQRLKQSAEGFVASNESVWLRRSDPRAQYVKALSDKGDKGVAAFAWLVFLGKDVPLTVTMAIKGFVYAAAFDAGLSDETARAEKKALEQVRSQWESFSGSSKREYSRFRDDFEGLQTDIQKLRAQQVERFDEVLEKGRLELEAIAKTYDEKLALQAPVAYWEGRVKIHKKRSKTFAWAFIISVVGVLALVGGASFVILPDMWAGEIPKDLGYWPLALLGGIAAFLIWPVRILSRVLLSNLHLLTDAEERVTMANTYLSLLRSESGLDPSNRKLILETLFRPASTGIVKDDAAGATAATLLSRLLSGDRKQ